MVGLGLGGWIAAEVATRNPERIGKLVLISSVGISLKDTPVNLLILPAFGARPFRFPRRCVPTPRGRGAGVVTAALSSGTVTFGSRSTPTGTSSRSGTASRGTRWTRGALPCR